MGAILGIIGIYVACVAIWWLITNVIAPVGKWVGIAAIGIGLTVGMYVAIKNYIKSLIHNRTPYTYYEDRAKKKQEFAKRRSYFFGPGFLQLKETIKDAWKYMWRSIKKIRGIRQSISDATDMMVIHQTLWVIAWIFYLTALIAIGFLGSAITFVLGTIHAAILITFMVIIYVLFSVIWLTDILFLLQKSIRTNCPYCQERSIIPFFECPSCRNQHTRLVPGPYGVLYRKCRCNEKLPTTFLLGRSRLKSYCPKCGHELAASDAQQFAISIVGGTSSGKTVLLSSFYHEFFQRLNTNMQVDYEIPELHEQMFRDLEDWFNGAPCRATALNETSDMYSVILKSKAFDVDKQFSIYDIAGEAFDDPQMARMLPQMQMRDSNGVVIVIDPLSVIDMRTTAKSEGDSITNYSEKDSTEVVSNFVTYLKSVLTNQKLRTKSKKPVAVVISKADLSSVSRHISYHKIKHTMSANLQAYESFDDARDKLCREFLQTIGLNDAVNAIEAGFSEVHYFPVSAMGHATNGEAYEPIHVTEPFYWLIRRSGSGIAELLGLN